MAYQMEYAMHRIEKKRVVKEHKLSRAILSVALLVAALIGAHFAGSVFQTLLLGENELAKVAAEELVSQLRDGVSFREAVQAFCMEIVQ